MDIRESPKRAMEGGARKVDTRPVAKNYFPGAKFITTAGSDDMYAQFFTTLTEATDHAFDRHAEVTSGRIEIKEALTGKWIATVEDNDMVAVDDIIKYLD